MRSLRVIHIDAKLGVLRELVLSGPDRLAELQSLVGGLIERVYEGEFQDLGVGSFEIYANEEALLLPRDYGFFLGKRLILGSGFVVGSPLPTDLDAEFTDCPLTAGEASAILSHWSQFKSEPIGDKCELNRDKNETIRSKS